MDIKDILRFADDKAGNLLSFVASIYSVAKQAYDETNN